MAEVTYSRDHEGSKWNKMESSAVSFQTLNHPVHQKWAYHVARKGEMFSEEYIFLLSQGSI